MKVILLKDIENLGKKGDVKNVANGHARNFLIPKKLVEPATKEALKELEQQKETEAREAEEALKKVESTVSEIDGMEFEVAEKADENGKLYGSINEVKVNQILKERGYEIKKSQIKIPQPIKETGEHPIMITFDHGLEAEIKLIIIDEAATKAKPATDEL